MIIKVCGLREKANILAIDTLSIDLMGMIFYEKSPRFVEDIADIPVTNTPKVGVFVDSSLEYILEKIEKYQLKYIQLHGNESPDFVYNLHLEMKAENIKIIKVFSIDNQEDNQKNSKINNDFMAEYVPFCDYFLFDTKGTNHGGTGIKFNWQILEGYTLKTPFLLSGGITADDIDEIKNIQHQQFVGIDINSKFEIKAGLKDVEMIKKFIENLKNCL